ncbi:hypothetical protein VF10_38460, partial [Nostoc linckia z13]
ARLEPTEKANLEFSTLEDETEDVPTPLPEPSIQKEPNTTKKNNNSVVCSFEVIKEEEPLTEVSHDTESTEEVSSLEPEDHHEDTSAPPRTPVHNDEADAQLERLDELGVRLSAPLCKLVRTTAAELVEVAISAYQEARHTNYIKNPAGYVVKAIKDGYQPSTGDNEGFFLAWYKLMRERGNVAGWEKGPDDYIVFDSTRQPIPFKEWVARGWTMEYLKRKR